MNGIKFKLKNNIATILLNKESTKNSLDRNDLEKITEFLKKIEKSPISIIQSEAISVDIRNYKIKSILLRSGEKINCSCVIITAGTFLSGLIHIGERKILAGRMGEERSEGITESLKSFGFFSGRLKTGTPPRIDKNSIIWSETSISLGDKHPTPFSYSTKNFTPPNEACHTCLLYTSPSPRDRQKSRMPSSA